MGYLIIVGSWASQTVVYLEEKFDVDDPYKPEYAEHCEK